MFKSAKEEGAFVEECLWSPDSGAFTTAILQKLLRKLRDRGSRWEKNKIDEPMQIDQAVAGITGIAESSSHLTLRVYTRLGPYYFEDSVF